MQTQQTQKSELKVQKEKIVSRYNTFAGILGGAFVVGALATGIHLAVMEGEFTKVTVAGVISLVCLVIGITTLIIMVAIDPHLRKYKNQWENSLEIFTKRAVIKIKNTRHDKDTMSTHYELVFETEKDTVHTFSVNKELYEAVSPNDVGVLVYKKDCEGITYFSGFECEGQLAEVSSEMSVCPNCRAPYKPNKFGAQVVCEYCDRVL